MRSRLSLQEKLEAILGSRNVYYQPPESVKMNYPAIRYSKRTPSVAYADDSKYLKTNCYELIVISKKPDDPVISELENLPLCEWDRHYTADNLHHDVLILFY